MTWELGQQVVFSIVLFRDSACLESSNRFGSGYQAFWNQRKLAKPKAGVLVGLRTLTDGETRFSVEDGNVYHPRKTVKAALVSYDLRRKPVLVPIEHLQPEGGTNV